VFTGTLWPWIVFNLFVLVMLALDLGVFHRNAHAVSIKEAAIWSAVWIGLAMLFNLGLYFFWHVVAPGSALSDGQAALAFFTGYLIEKSLSVDNIFVFALLFGAFAVPAARQHRVLFWGILGALLMRGVLIVAGAALLERFHWIIYIFGGFLIFTGIRMFMQRDEEAHPEKTPLISLAQRFIPIAQDDTGEHFFVRRAGRWMATPLFLVLLIVEATDLVFAVDSIPAIFAVTREPFLVSTSNVFAILGLRSLYFVLAGVMDKFHYLKLGLAAVLSFVGVKMVLVDLIHIPIGLSLGVIASILAIAVGASLLRARRLPGKAPTAP
jgi:tellurite resistance protein TerC